MIRRTVILAACTLGLGAGVATWTLPTALAQDAAAPAAEKTDMDMSKMKDSMMKVQKNMSEEGNKAEMQKDMMRMKMIHEMMMNDPECKKMCDEMKADPKMKEMTDDQKMSMKKEIMNESPKNEEMMRTMMIHMMAKDSMMKHDGAGKEADKK